MHSIFQIPYQGYCVHVDLISTERVERIASKVSKRGNIVTISSPSLIPCQIFQLHGSSKHIKRLYAIDANWHQYSYIILY